MKFAFMGNSNIRRVVGDVVWSRENGHVAEVANPRLCADLLTSPGSEFAVTQDEPLMQVIPDWEKLADLALFGIASIEALAELNKQGITALVEFTGRDVKEIRAWVTRAKQVHGGSK
jgi:hypothetical protein